MSLCTYWKCAIGSYLVEMLAVPVEELTPESKTRQQNRVLANYHKVKLIRLIHQTLKNARPSHKRHNDNERQAKTSEIIGIRRKNWRTRTKNSSLQKQNNGLYSVFRYRKYLKEKSIQWDVTRKRRQTPQKSTKQLFTAVWSKICPLSMVYVVLFIHCAANSVISTPSVGKINYLVRV